MKKKDTSFVRLSPKVSASSKTGNVFEITSYKSSRTDPYTKIVAGQEIVPWGKDNIQPHHDRQLIAYNDIKQPIINMKVALLCGKRLFFYRDVITEDGKKEMQLVDDPELEEWLKEEEIENLFKETIQDLEEFGNSFAEFILSRDKSIITSVESMNLVDCRLTPAINRQDSETLAVGDWLKEKGGRTLTKNEIALIPLLPIRKSAKQLGKHFKTALHVKDHISGFPYYNNPCWFGTKDITEVANIIPKFHLQGLKNGYMMRYHIQIPESYFAKYGTEEEKQAEMSRIQEELDTVISGAENAHKAFYSFTKMLGGNTEEWKITKIETDLKDESYLKLHEVASKTHARGHNIHPVLTGIETSGSLSSGSEILNLLNFFIAYVAPGPRKLAMRPIELFKDYNFPDKKDIKIGVEDTVLTTIDKNPTGRENAA